jgi:pimeloyl-ACP methyl ester carboxylesterase
MPTLNINGDALHYTDEGIGIPITFVHGSCGGGGQWRTLAGELSKDHRTICIDMLGSGQSDAWPIERPWTPEADEPAIDALLALIAEPVQFVIHSAGGHYTYRSISKHRQQIRSLTYFEPVFFHLLHQSEDPLFAEPEGMSDRFRAFMDEGDRDLAMASFVDVWAAKDGAWNSLPDPVKDFMRLGSDRLYHEWLSVWYEQPSREDLAGLDLPVLLFKGGDTLAAMHRVCEIFRHALPDCAYVELDGAGHMSPFTHANEALPFLRQHLASH